MMHHDLFRDFQPISLSGFECLIGWSKDRMVEGLDFREEHRKSVCHACVAVTTQTFDQTWVGMKTNDSLSAILNQYDFRFTAHGPADGIATPPHATMLG